MILRPGASALRSLLTFPVAGHIFNIFFQQNWTDQIASIAFCFATQPYKPSLFFQLRMKCLLPCYWKISQPSNQYRINSKFLNSFVHENWCGTKQNKLMNACDIAFQYLCLGWPFWLLFPGAKKPSHTSACQNSRRSFAACFSNELDYFVRRHPTFDSWQGVSVNLNIRVAVLLVFHMKGPVS